MNRVPLDAQKKNLTKEEIKKKELEEESRYIESDQLEIPPSWLINEIAVVEWKRLVKEFSKKSMISNLDYNNLGAYCNSFAKYIELAQRLKLNFMVGKEANPLVALELKYSDEMKKYGSLLGLTTESRLKIGSGKIEEQGKEINNEFGEI